MMVSRRHALSILAALGDRSFESYQGCARVGDERTRGTALLSSAKNDLIGCVTGFAVGAATLKLLATIFVTRLNPSAQRPAAWMDQGISGSWEHVAHVGNRAISPRSSPAPALRDNGEMKDV